MNRIGYDIEAVLAAPCDEGNISYPLYWILTSYVNEEDLCEFEARYVRLQEFRSRLFESGFCRYLDDEDFHELIYGLQELRAIDGALSKILATEIEEALKELEIMNTNGSFGNRPIGDEDEVDGIGFSLDRRFEGRLQGSQLETEIHDYLQVNADKLISFSKCSRIFVPGPDGKGEVRPNPQ